MDEGLTTSKNIDFLHIQASGPVLPEGIRQFFLQIPEAARIAGLKKILVDARTAEGSFDTLQRFEYGNMMARHFRGLQVAIVINDALMGPDAFGETVAVNRGANIRVFTDTKKARCWLGVPPVDRVEAVIG